MGKPFWPLRSAIAILLGLGLLLPIAQAVLFWVERLLVAMGDAGGGHIMARIRLGLAVLWLLVLALLVIVLAADRLGEPDDAE